MDFFGIRSVSPPDTGPILFFDGECGLCGAAVRFVVRWDRQARFRFAALESTAGRAYLAGFGVAPEVNSLVVTVGNRCFLRSDAVLEILRQLGGMWHLLRLGGLLPTSWRNALYGWVAARRTRFSRWLGFSCLRPTEALLSRFL